MKDIKNGKFYFIFPKTPSMLEIQHKNHILTLEFDKIDFGYNKNLTAKLGHTKNI